MKFFRLKISEPGERLARALFMIAILGLLLTGGSAVDMAQSRVFDQLWASYLPTVQKKFEAVLYLDDATYTALGERPHRAVRMRLRLDKYGRVLTSELARSSGIASFDHACVQAGLSLGRLPQLPAEILEHGRRIGLEFDFGTRE